MESAIVHGEVAPRKHLWSQLQVLDALEFGAYREQLERRRACQSWPTHAAVVAAALAKPGW